MTDHTYLIERLRRPTITPSVLTCREAADALAAMVKERDDCIADRTKLRTLLDCKREDIEALVKERDAYKRAKQENDERFMLERDALQARVKRLEDALRGVRDHQPAHCGCGVEGCIEVEEAWDEVRAALAGDKP